MKIFVASTGRSGTKFFASIFGQLTGFPAYHEPMPFIIGRTLREVNTKALYSPETARELTEKVNQVTKWSLAGDYMEASQMFIKGYAELMLKAFRRIIVIYLERNPMDVLLSYAEKCEQQDADWMLQSHWQKNLLRTLRPLSFYENVLWNWYEVRERFLELRPRVSAHYSFAFEDLNRPAAWKEMLETLEIPFIPFTDLPEGEFNAGEKDTAWRLTHLRVAWKNPGQIKTDEQPDHYSIPAEVEFHKNSQALHRAILNRGQLSAGRGSG